ncbi:MAG: hypothetical protein NTY19_22520, partial [Planctomycetota bacterium]|nr:hypothetical protein [Planctomycetota bacterium]
MLKKLDETLPLAETSSLANADLAGRFYLACRGVLECGGLTPLCVSLSRSALQKPPTKPGRLVSACRLAPAGLNAGRPRRQTNTEHGSPEPCRIRPTASWTFEPGAGHLERVDSSQSNHTAPES